MKKRILMGNVKKEIFNERIIPREVYFGYLPDPGVYVPVRITIEEDNTKK